MNPVWDAGHFVRLVRNRLRCGELSRAHLRLLRLELREELAECEWMARPPDAFDSELSAAVAQRNQTLQALQDAMAVRELLFDALPQVRTAKLRVYRSTVGGSVDLIITGTVSREDPEPLRVSSIATRAKLCGFHFSLEDGVLEPLHMKDRNLEFAT
jgi:hypothetical protein